MVEHLIKKCEILLLNEAILLDALLHNDWDEETLKEHTTLLVRNCIDIQLLIERIKGGL